MEGKDKIEIKFYGAAREVGRSCIMVNSEFLFDSGIKISEEGTEYPLIGKDELKKIKAVFLSHAHLDHSGALPLFNKLGFKGEIFATSMTKDITRILLKDSFHIEMLNKEEPGYTKENIQQAINQIKKVNYFIEYNLKGTKFRYFDSGHIPGSASVLIELKGKRILYSGDINSRETRLLRKLEYEKYVPKIIDTLICESTYGDRNHEDRKKQEENFIEKIKETLHNKGTVLIPAFSVGRAQEIILLLDSHNIRYPVYLDGMAKKVSNLFLKNTGWIKSHDSLSKALNKVIYIKKPRQREEVSRKNAIIITTSGMMDGGPVIDYLEYLWKNPKNSILLTGYQVEGSNGRLLLDEGKVFIDGIRVKVKAFYKKYDFSAHSGRNELIRYIETIKPKALILQHGDETAIMSLAEYFKGKGIKVYTPKLNESISI